MLLNKRLLVFSVIFLFLLSSISYAQVCEVDRIKQVLKKILFLYYTEPGNVPLTKDEVKDMLVFYLSINDQNLTVDCSAFGSKSNKPISDVVSEGENVPDKIPSCSDETKYGECSKYRPAYCYAGSLYSRCELCGCPANSVCGKSKKCESTSQNITCFKDVDCGQSGFSGDYFCTNNYISKNYIIYNCSNQGTTISSCLSTTQSALLTYCNPNLNQTCVAGQSYCKVPIVPIINTSTTTANQTNQTTFDTLTIKGRFVDRFSGMPVPNAGIWLVRSPSDRLGTFYADTNGYFAVTISTIDITQTISKVLFHFGNCYQDDGAIAIRRYPTNGYLTDFPNYPPNALYVSVNPFDLTRTPIFFAATVPEVNIGNFPLWPSSDFSLLSDIPVKFDISYPEESRSSGNSGYLTTHYLRNVIPLNYNVRAQLTDSVGNIYFSPYTNAPLSTGCGPINLNFINKQFSWNMTAQVNTTNQTSTTPTGICLVSDSYTSVPVFSAPDLGVGYAKKAIPGVNTASGLLSACTNSTFYEIMKLYCTQNSNPMTQQKVTYSSTGNWQTSGCGANGCSYYFCKYLDYPPPNSGVCMVSDIYTSISQIAFWDPDIGVGYAKKAIPGVNTDIGLWTACTNDTYYNLLQSYCTQNSNKVQSGRVTYGPGGGWQSSGCGAIGCNYLNCSLATNQTTQTCTDSDGGNNINVKGTTTVGNDAVTDFCSGSYVTEGWCSNGIRYQASYLCSNGCSDGACVNQTTTNQTNASFKCTDSDNGLNYFLYGTTNGYKAYWVRNSSNIVTEKDSCTTICSGSVGSGIGSTGQCLIEYYCDSSDYAAFNVYQCPYGCSGGACVQQTTTLSQCNVLDFEDYDPSVGGTPKWRSQLIGTPDDNILATKIYGPVGTTGIIVGVMSPNGLEQDLGLSDNEQLIVYFINASPKSVQVGLTTVPSNVQVINNIPSTVVVDALDSTGNLVATTTKTFTGVTNGVYTPTKINVTASAPNIAKINLRTTQHPYGGVYIEDVNSCS